MRSRKFLKLFFAGFAMILVVLVFWLADDQDMIEMPAVKSPEDRLESVRQGVEQELAGGAVDPDLAETVMSEPRFSGEDNKDQSWELVAKEARQRGGSEGEILLNEVNAKATAGSGKTLEFKAGQGQFDQKNETLALKDKVKIEGYGLTLEAEEVESNLKDHTAGSEHPVTLKSKAGELTAGKFNLEQNGEVIRLSGGVKGVFYPKDGAEATADNNEQKE